METKAVNVVPLKVARANGTKVAGTRTQIVMKVILSKTFLPPIAEIACDNVDVR